MNNETRLDEMISLWERHHEDGRDVPAAELCRDHPELIEVLGQRIAALRRMNALMPSDSRPPAPGTTESLIPPDAGMRRIGLVSDGAVRASPASAESRADSSPQSLSFPGYEILRELGRGGMGVVYEARQQRLDRRVAIKVSLPGADMHRFLREARLLAKVKSPYVVVVHDFTVLANGWPALVMEWVEGSSLNRLLTAEARPLEEAKVLTWMRQVCDGMLAAAQEGIIHRDLKPSNLLLDASGNIRVADFGLARGAAALNDLTRSGEVMGTPHYMAPEQAEDPHGVDTRADIYSFGATFYHALTGTPPFTGPTAFAVLYKHKTEPLVALRTRNSALSRRTSEVLERCLAKAPADRFASFAEVRTAMQPSAGPGSPWDFSDDPALTQYLERYRARRDSYLEGTRRWETELDVYHFPRGQTLRIIRGNLVRQPVEALVSSDIDLLGMGGQLSETIRLAAGPTVTQQADRLAPVRPGRVAVTGAGELPARFIFHAVTAGYLQDQIIRPSRDLIVEIMAACFYHADSHNVRSIAFPLVGSGAQRFPRDTCLDTIFQCLARLLLRGLTSLQDARIVLFD